MAQTGSEKGAIQFLEQMQLASHLALDCGFCRMAVDTSRPSIPLCAWLLPRLFGAAHAHYSTQAPPQGSSHYHLLCGL